jgi:hypothetical protein
MGIGQATIESVDSTDTIFIDDARTNGTIGNDPAYGPRVRR